MMLCFHSHVWLCGLSLWCFDSSEVLKACEAAKLLFSTSVNCRPLGLPLSGSLGGQKTWCPESLIRWFWKLLLCFWALLKDADNNCSEAGQDISCTLVNPFGLAHFLSIPSFSVYLSIFCSLSHTLFLSPCIVCFLTLLEYKIQNELSAFSKYLVLKLTYS